MKPLPRWLVVVAVLLAVTVLVVVARQAMSQTSAPSQAEPETIAREQLARTPTEIAVSEAAARRKAATRSAEAGAEEGVGAGPLKHPATGAEAERRAAARGHDRTRPRPSAGQQAVPAAGQRAGRGRWIQQALQLHRHRHRQRRGRGDRQHAAGPGRHQAARGARRSGPTDAQHQQRAALGPVHRRSRTVRQAGRRPADGLVARRRRADRCGGLPRDRPHRTRAVDRRHRDRVAAAREGTARRAHARPAYPVRATSEGAAGWTCATTSARSTWLTCRSRWSRSATCATPTDARRMTTATGRATYAEGIVRGIRRFLDR